MPSAHVEAQLRAQGIDPKTMQPAKGAGKNLVTNPRTPAPTTTPATLSALNGGGKNKAKTNDPTPAQLRPRYQVGQYIGFEGKRMAFVGLTDELVDRLRVYAKTLGILEQN